MRLQKSPAQRRKASRRQTKRRSETSLDAWSFRVPAKEVNLYANHKANAPNRFNAFTRKTRIRKKLESVKCGAALKDKKHRSLGSFRDNSYGSKTKPKLKKIKNLEVDFGKNSLRRRVLKMKYESFNLKGRGCMSRGKENKRIENQAEARGCETMKEPFWGGESYAAQIKAKAEALKRKVFMKCVRSQERKSPNGKSKGYLRMFLPRKKRIRVDVSKKNHKVPPAKKQKQVEMICSNQFTPVHGSQDVNKKFDAATKKCRKNLKFDNLMINCHRKPDKSAFEMNEISNKLKSNANPRLEAFKTLFRSKSASEIESSNQNKKIIVRKKIQQNAKANRPSVVSHFDFEKSQNSRLKGQSMRSWSRKLKERSREIIKHKNKHKNWRGSLKKRLLSKRNRGKTQGNLKNESTKGVGGRSGPKRSVGWKGGSINVLNNNVNNTTYLKCSINIFDHSKGQCGSGKRTAGHEACKEKKNGKRQEIADCEEKNVGAGEESPANLNSQSKSRYSRGVLGKEVSSHAKPDLGTTRQADNLRNEDSINKRNINLENTNSDSENKEFHTQKWVIPRPPCAEKWLLAVEDLISELSPERESSSRGDVGTVLKTSKESPVPSSTSYPVQEKRLWTERTSKKEKQIRRQSAKESAGRRMKTTGNLSINRKGLEIRVPSSISGKEPQVEISLPESPNIKIMLPQSLTRELLESLRISCTTPKNASPSLEKYLNSISKCIKEMNFITKVEHLESGDKEGEKPVTPKNGQRDDGSGVYSKLPRRSFKKKARHRGRIKPRKGHLIGLDDDAAKQSDLGQFIELMSKPGHALRIENVGTPKAKKTTVEKVRIQIARNERTQKKMTTESPVSETGSGSAKLDFLKIDDGQINSFGVTSSGSYPQTSGQDTKSGKSSNWKVSSGQRSKSKKSSKWKMKSRKGATSKSRSSKSSNWTNYRSQDSRPSSTWTESKRSSNWKQSDSSLYQFKSLNHRTVTEGSSFASGKNTGPRKTRKEADSPGCGTVLEGIRERIGTHRVSSEPLEEVEDFEGLYHAKTDQCMFDGHNLDTKMILSKANTNQSNKLEKEVKLNNREDQTESEKEKLKSKGFSDENLLEAQILSHNHQSNENVSEKTSDFDHYTENKEKCENSDSEDIVQDVNKSQNSFSDIYVGMSQNFESDENFELKEVLLSEQKSNFNEQHSFSVSNLKVIKSRQIFGSRAKSPKIDSKASRAKAQHLKSQKKSRTGFDEIASNDLNKILISSFKTRGENVDSKDIDAGIEGLLEGIDGMRDDLLDPLECEEVLKQKKPSKDDQVGPARIMEIEGQDTQISNLETGTFRNKRINPFLKNKNLDSGEKNIFYEEVQDHIGKIGILDICDPDSPRTLNKRKNYSKNRNIRVKSDKHHFSETNNSLGQNSIRSPKKGMNILAHLRRIKASVLQRGSVRESFKTGDKKGKDVSIYDRLRLLHLGSHRQIPNPGANPWSSGKGRLRIKPRETQPKKEQFSTNQGKVKKAVKSKNNNFKKCAKNTVGKIKRHQYSLSNNFVPGKPKQHRATVNPKTQKKAHQKNVKKTFFSRKKRSQANTEKIGGSSGVMVFPKTNNLTFCENELLYSPEMSFGPKRRLGSPDSLLYVQNASPRNIQMQSQNQINRTGRRKVPYKTSKYSSFGDFGKIVRKRGKIGVKNLFSKKYSVRQVRSQNLMKK